MKRDISRIVCVWILFVLMGINHVRAEEEKSFAAIWHFDGEGDVLKDSSGRGHDGRIDGAVWVEGKFGRALQFDGVDDYVEVSNSPDWAWEPGASFTIEAWIKTDTDGVILTTYNRSREYFSLSVYRSMAYLGFRDKVNKAVEYRAAKVNDGNWHHIAFVRNRPAKKVDAYVDGQLASSVDDTTEAGIYSEYPLTIGAVSVEHNSYFKGLIDEVRIYNRALSHDEIEEDSKGRYTNFEGEPPKEQKENKELREKISYFLNPEDLKQAERDYYAGLDILENASLPKIERALNRKRFNPDSELWPLKANPEDYRKKEVLYHLAPEDFGQAKIYNGDFSCPEDWRQTSARLFFPLARYFSKIHVNEQLVGEHSGNSPFWFDVREKVKSDMTNKLKIEITPGTSGDPHEGAHLDFPPYLIFTRSPFYLKEILITPDIDKNQIKLKVDVNRILPGGGKLVALVTDLDFQKVYGQAETNLNSVSQELTLNVNGYKLWSPEEPNLYYLRCVFLDSNKKIIDVTDERFGFRKFEAKNGNFYLNNKKFFLKGSYPSAMMPDELSIRAPWSDRKEDKEAWLKGVWHFLNVCRALNFNTIYMHLDACPYSEELLDLFDEAGFLMLGMPLFPFSNDAKRNWEIETAPLPLEEFKKQVWEQFVSDWNHPSAAIYAFSLELAGSYLREGDLASFRKLKSYYILLMEWVKKVNPAGVFSDSAGGCNFTGKSDYADEHHYAGWYHTSVPDLVGRAIPGHFLKEGTNNRAIPFIMSECCGMYLLNSPSGSYADTPDLKSYGSVWLGEKGTGDWKASRTYQAWGYKGTIEGMRINQTGGILPFALNQAFYEPRLYEKPNDTAFTIKIGMSPVLISFPSYTQRYFRGGKFISPVYIVNDTNGELKGAKLACEVKDDEGNVVRKEERLLSIPPFSCKMTFQYEWDIPQDQKPGKYILRATLYQNEKMISFNSHVFLVYQKEDYRIDQEDLKVVLYDPKGTTKPVLDSLGIRYSLYQYLGTLEGIDLLIIGADAIDRNFLTSYYKDIKRFAGNSKNGVVLILDQNFTSPLPPISEENDIVALQRGDGTPEVFRWLTDSGTNGNANFCGMIPQTCGFWRYNFADVGSHLDHPVFSGLGYWDFNLWNDYNGTIHAGDRMLNSIRLGKEGWDVLAVASYRDGACLAETCEYLVSQFMAVRRFGTDPIAAKYLHNLISYSLQKSREKEKIVSALRSMENWFKKEWQKTGGHPNMKLTVSSKLFWQVLHKSPEGAPHRTDEGEGSYLGYRFVSEQPIKEVEFDYTITGADRVELQLLDDEGKVLWRVSGLSSGHEQFENINLKGIEFRFFHIQGILYPSYYGEIKNLKINGSKPYEKED